ncbi:3-dehydroquinate dehydratase [cyanobacterium endosymbiont of Rhopalodia gibberula]|uniref:type II 3-dehydroquinate dehydratase n=1 Tax=cyanobacterium endosymbiont of Rhopalodia gibberula TaxID=1763363 RepID=UPI000DC6EEA9|nr:type II 3-dehydroquinate dehydratase [cyanobacterium endosymbiont of Rhopalodia gibberula]BBA79120.1 3-dehydroquinate dehydratase [cyanobacterium endosymbiont of Rhopalodia gibberula]
MYSETFKRLNILVLHGPNLNLLGKREPLVYGSVTLDSINYLLTEEADSLGVNLECMQSNHEGILVDAIHDSSDKYQGIIINAGAYTHTSIAIRDALSAVKVPTVEVHMSNVYKREDFRHHSYIAAIVIGQISGFGVQSYKLGLYALVDILRSGK